MKIIIGVDPGISGGIAIIRADGVPLLCEPLPIIRDGSLAWVDGGRMQSILIDTLEGSPACALIERAQPMPKQGSASGFNYGVGFGSLLAIFQARGIPIELIAPSRWKGAMGLTSKKTLSLDKARLLYPSIDLPRAKDEGRAEALLLAHYGLMRPPTPKRPPRAPHLDQAVAS
jgi:crossover junction endodeoxyribonuclease RuvC